MRVGAGTLLMAIALEEHAGDTGSAGKDVDEDGGSERLMVEKR